MQCGMQCAMHAMHCRACSIVRQGARRGRVPPKARAARDTPGDSRPRRCDDRSGRGCAGSAGSRSPAWPRPAPRRCRCVDRNRRAPPRPAPAGAGLAAHRVDQGRVLSPQVSVVARRRLVRDLVRAHPLRMVCRSIDGGYPGTRSTGLHALSPAAAPRGTSCPCRTRSRPRPGRRGSGRRA